MKKLITILLLTAWVYLCMVIIVKAIGSWFFEDRFTTPDAAPLADPHTTEPGGQSVDAIETDGTMAIANGKLTFTAQSSPVDGDLGLRYATDMSDFMGRAIFYKLKFNSLANGIAGFGNASELFGTTGAADITFDGVNRRGFGTNATRFIGWTSGTAAHDFDFLTLPTTTDSFYCAIVQGGSSSTSGSNSPTWYLGQSAASFNKGCFYFVKKNATGKWLLQGKSYGTEESADAFLAITDYNGAFSVDDWMVSNDTLRDGYLSPVHLQKMTGTSGNQLFDDIPEVGAAYDSVGGDWQFTADNRIHPAGSNPGGDLAWFTTTTTSDDEVVMESSPTLRFGDGADMALVLRYKASPLSFMLVYLTAGNNAMELYTYESGTFTQRATTGNGVVSFPLTDSPSYLVGTVYDSASTTILKGWYQEASGVVFNLRYTHASNFNSGQTRHGLRANGTGTNIEFDEVRIYPLGADNEYSGLDDYFATGGRRRFIVQ